MDFDVKANQMAKELGFASAEHTDLMFDGWSIFDPIMPPREKNEGIPSIGMPMFILAKGDTVRWTVGDEGLKVLRLLNKKREEEEPDEDEDAGASFEEQLDALRERAEMMKELDELEKELDELGQ